MGDSPPPSADDAGLAGLPGWCCGENEDDESDPCEWRSRHAPLPDRFTPPPPPLLLGFPGDASAAVARCWWRRAGMKSSNQSHEHEHAPPPPPPPAPAPAQRVAHTCHVARAASAAATVPPAPERICGEGGKRDRKSRGKRSEVGVGGRERHHRREPLTRQLQSGQSCAAAALLKQNSCRPQSPPGGACVSATHHHTPTTTHQQQQRLRLSNSDSSKQLAVSASARV